MANSTLEDTTLATIVRDEFMNPAGGVELWLRCTLPHVPQAVVVDTGSVDGTRDVLADLSKEFPHLRVYDHKFDGFAKSRNVSLSHVRTPWVLIQDADELLEPEDFTRLQEFRRENPAWGYEFTFEELFADVGEAKMQNVSVLNPRLFKRLYEEKAVLFKSHQMRVDENLPSKLGPCINVEGITIKHFLATKKAEKLKHTKWYREATLLTEQPLTIGKRDGWKAFNPQRHRFYWPPEIKDGRTYLDERGREYPPAFTFHPQTTPQHPS